MHLLPCHRPQGSLEAAPRTALRADSARERWDGFWSDADEGYYARCTRPDGSEQWYRVADDAAPRERVEARVLTLRSKHRERVTSRQMLLLVSRGATGPNGRRPILVGTSRRRPRATRAGSGGRR